MKFNSEVDLDRNELIMRATNEAKLIFSKPGPRKGRSLNRIIDTCLIGHAPELYLIKYEGFSDDPRPYKDVLAPAPDFVPWEIKATGDEKNVGDVLRRCNQAAGEAFREYAKRLMIFIHDSKTNDYYLYGKYEYVNFRFINENKRCTST